MSVCPNKSHPTWKPLVEKVGENLAYYYWSKGEESVKSALQDSDNTVNYNLQAVDILSSDKAVQVFEKGKKNGWDLNKILTELQVPKEQKQIILDKYENKESDVEAKVRELERDGLLEIDCKGKLKAEKGLQTNFTKGGKWKLIKDLKGYPTHKEGGVDLTIGKNDVSIKNGNTEFTAKHGLVIPKG
jgi:hypothetical protein